MEETGDDVKYEGGKQWQTRGLQKSLWTVTESMKLKNACSLEEKLWQT